MDERLLEFSNSLNKDWLKKHKAKISRVAFIYYKESWKLVSIEWTIKKIGSIWTDENIFSLATHIINIPEQSSYKFIKQLISPFK